METIVGSVRKSNCVEGCRIGILWLVFYTCQAITTINSVNIRIAVKLGGH